MLGLGERRGGAEVVRFRSTFWMYSSVCLKKSGMIGWVKSCPSSSIWGSFDHVIVDVLREVAHCGGGV